MNKNIQGNIHTYSMSKIIENGNVSSLNEQALFGDLNTGKAVYVSNVDGNIIKKNIKLDSLDDLFNVNRSNDNLLTRLSKDFNTEITKNKNSKKTIKKTNKKQKQKKNKTVSKK